jgi:predicted phage tail protein
MKITFRAAAMAAAAMANLIQTSAMDMAATLQANLRKYRAPARFRTPRGDFFNLAGAGGGKGGGGSTRAPHEAPDSVRSKAYGRTKEVVSEGPIVGPIDADGVALAAENYGKAIFFDETPLQNADGSFNFKNVTVHFVPGTADQGHIPGFDSEEAEIAVGVRAIEAGDVVVRSVTNQDIDAVRVTVRIPALIKQDSSTGDITGYSVAFAIDVNDNGAGWVEKVNRTVSDKISQAYLTSHRIDLEGTGPWQIRLRRISAKSSTSAIQNETWFESYSEIIDGKFRHPFTAMFGLEIDAEQFSRIPNVAFRLGGRIIRVPTNYDPVARTYSGVWDGTFKLAWSNCPPWVYYDLLTSKRYGLGKWIDEDIVDKWALYAIGVVCDTMVPNGRGGTEPLYTCNLCVEQEVDAYRALYDLASVFHGLAIWAGGQFSALQDAPRDAVAIFGNANVEGGLFEYTGTSKEARHTVCNVWWNNPANFYRREPLYVPDEKGIFDYGINPTDLTAFGCTSEGQAVRRGRHLLLSEQLAKSAVTFITGQEGAFLRPNQVFKVMDADKAGKPFFGRLKAVNSTSSLQLDRSVVIEAGKTYKLTCVKPDGTPMQSDVSNAPGTTDTLTLSVAFPTAPLVSGVWLLQSNSLVPQEFECIGWKPEGKGKYRIAGIAYNVSKFDGILNGWQLDTPPVSELQPARLVKPPGAVTITEESISNPISFRTFLNLSWVPSEDAYLRGYRVYWRYESGNWQPMPEVSAPNQRLETIGLGVYDFKVVAVNSLGFESGPSSASHTVEADSPIENARVTGLEIFGKGNDQTFEGRDCKFVWRMNSALWHELGEEPNGGDSGFAHPLFRDYLVTVYDWQTSEILRQESVQDPSWTYTYEKNAEDALRYAQQGGSTSARRKFRITVQIRDRFNNLSVPASLLVENPAPAAPVFTLTPDLAAVVVRFTPSADLDFVGFVVHASQTAGFTVSDANKVYDGPDTLTRIKLDPGVTWYFRLAAYDAFGKSGLNFSVQQSAIPAITLDTTPPAVPTGVALTSELVNEQDGTQRIKLIGSWTANTEEDFSKYHWRIKEVAAGPFDWVHGTASGKDSTRIEFTAKANTNYELQVAASDRDENKSAYSASATHITTRDTTPPAVPVWIAGNASFRNIFLAWQNPTDSDFDSVELYENTVNDSGTATRIFPAADDQPGLRGTSHIVSKPATGDFTGATFYYWLKSRDTSGNRSGFSLVQAVTMSGVPTPTGLTLSTDLVTNPDRTQTSYLNASVDTSGFAEFGGFTWEVEKVDASIVWRGDTKTNSIRIPVPGNTLLFVRVRMNDQSTGRSAFTAFSSIVSAKDTTAPDAPSGFVANSAVASVFLEWTIPPVIDCAEIWIYRNTTGTPPTPGVTTPYKKLGRDSGWTDDGVTQGVTYYYWLTARDTSQNESVLSTVQSTTPGKVQTTDINDYAVTLTKRFNATIALSGDVWSNNSPGAGKIAWNAHTLHFQGTAYSISAGDTNAIAGDAWVYWDPATPTVYQVSATNPTLTDAQFMIATNVAGVHDLAWNAMANALIGTAYIENLAVTNAKILSLAVDKLTAGTINAKEIIIAGGTAGIIRSADYSAGSAGWAIWHGGAEFNNVTVRGSITGSTISIGAGANDVFKVDLSGNIWSGHANFASAPFKVSNSGVLTATGATISGNVQARSIEAGQTVVIGSTGLEASSIIQSFGFSSGSTGWRIVGNGTGEFNSLTLRGVALITGSISNTATIDGANAGTVATGGSRAATALNSSNNLVTAFAPGSVAPAAGTGLFLGSDKLGFYDAGTWKTYMDNAGRFYLGGTSGKLRWDGAALIVEGSILAASTIDGTAASTVKDGAARANAGLDNAGKLITAVLPGATVGAAPATNGLFLGSDYLGYYNAGWKTFMDNSGNFYLGGTGGNLTWSAGTSTLTIQGTSIFKGSVDIGSGLNRVAVDSSNGLRVGDLSGNHTVIWNNGTYGLLNMVHSGIPRVTLGFGGGATAYGSVGLYDGAGGGTLRCALRATTTPELELGSGGILRSDGGNQLSIYTAGSQRFRVDATDIRAFMDFSTNGNHKIKLNVSATSVVYSDENWGWNIHGDGTHPLTLVSCALKLNGAGSGGTYTAGRIYFTDSVYLYESAGVLYLNDGNGDRALT